MVEPKAKKQQQTHILHVFHSFRVGGSETRTCQLINALGDAYRHTVVSLNGDFAARTLIASQHSVSFVHAEGFSNRSYLSNAMTARRWLRSINPDLMIAHSWGGCEWLVGNALCKLCPDIFSIEGFDTDEAYSENPKRRIVRMLVAKRVSALHACSLKLRNQARYSWHAADSRTHYIPNGVDVTRFHPDGERATGRSLIVGSVGSLIEVKNHRLLIEAFARLECCDAVLWIVGEGPERAALQEQVCAAGLGNRVTFMGHSDDPAPIVRQFDVFCLSSRSEQMPIAVIEAMASGLPIVSTDVGDVKEMVTESNRSFIVPPNDPDAYSRALATLLGDEALRAAIGAENRKRCEDEFGFDLMVRRHRELYNRCMVQNTS